jgi:hypothetical protein
MSDRGWARQLLEWGWVGPLLTAEVSRAKYFVRADRHETTAWAELRGLDGRRRIEVGSFANVAAAKAACEADAERRCRRDDAEERAPVSVAIGGRRRGRPRTRARLFVT